MYNQSEIYANLEKEFREFYHNQVKPILPEYERKRKEGAPKTIVFHCGWFSFLIGFSLTIYWVFHDLNNILPLGVGLIFVFIALALLLLLSYLTRNDNKTYFKSGGYQVDIKTDYERDLKNKLMKPFLSIFSNIYSWRQGTLYGEDYKDKVKEYRKSNIFNPFPGIMFDDLISLTLKNVRLNMYEVNICIFSVRAMVFYVFILGILGGYIGYVVILYLIAALCVIFLAKIIRYASFRGVVVELKMNKRFKGHTFFLDNSLKSKKIAVNRKIYDEIKLESVNFEKKYRVYSTDQVEARYLLTTAMMERLENLKFAFHANFVRGSFKDNKLILAIDTGKDMFAMGNDFKESNAQTFRELFDEIVSIMKIVDQLEIDKQTGL